MKKALAVIFASTMVLSLAACGGSSSSSTPATEAATEAASEAAETEAASEGAETQAAAESEAGQFVFKHGFDLDYPPYSHLDDNGDVSGFDVELAQAMCEYLGWGYEPVPFNWDAKDAELAAGSCDCIWSGFTVEGREDDYAWSEAYSNNTQMILVAEDSGITSLADLAGKAVGVQTATSAYDLLQDEEGQKELADTFSNLEVYETYTIAFNDLQAGAIDALAIDATAGDYLIRDTEGYVYLDEPLGSEHYAIGFRKDDTALRDQVNEALMALVENGTYAEIGAKYPEIEPFLCLGK